MRRAARTDANQQAIVSALRSIGASVWVTKLPTDLLVGYRGKTIVVEVKDGSKPPSERKHTKLQRDFIESWRGVPVLTVLDPIGAIEAVTAAASSTNAA